MINRSYYYLLLFCCLALCINPLASANENNSIEALLDNNKLIVTSKIKVDESQIVGQPLILSIEVATDRWFAKGTHVKRFSLANITILASSELAINSTKKINGATWASQIREITLYPNKAQTYTLPEIEIEISINTKFNGVVSGSFFTEPQQFTIALPQALEKIESFVVSPLFTLEVETTTNDSSPEKIYAVGDAITQIITLIAQNTPAMMIPEIKPISLTGLSVYKQPSQVFDKNNRGELVGTRIESSTYIFEQKGKYKIPKQIIYWWNSQSNELIPLIIPASEWEVGKAAVPPNKSFSKRFLTDGIFQNIIVLLGLLLIFLVVVLYIKQNNQRLWFYYKKITKQEKRQTKKRFLTAIKQQNYIAARQYFYAYSDTVVNKHMEVNEIITDDIAKLLHHLNECAFATNDNSVTTFSNNQAKQLLKLLNQKVNTKRSKTNIFDKPVNLNKPS